MPIPDDLLPLRGDHFWDLPLLEAWNAMRSAFGSLEADVEGKAPITHSHTQAQVTGLTTALAGKAPTTHSHAIGQVTGLDSELSGKAPLTHTHTTAQVTGLDTALAAKSPTSHTHTASQITDASSLGRSILTATAAATIRTAIDAAAGTHSHTTAQVTGLDAALAARAAEGHTHTASEIRDSTAFGQSVVKAADATAARTLLGAAPTTHNHTAAQTTSGTFAAARLPAATETAIGAVELATAAEVNAGTDTTRVVTPATLSSWSALTRPNRTRAVFIGSSNVAASSTAWPTLLGAERGWTVHNYAIGGTGYYTLPSTDRFRQQVANAVAGMTSAQRAEVGHFFVGDASNDARSNTTYANMRTEANAVYSAIRTNFPNARIVVIPVIWPADTQKYTPSIWSYDPKWNGSALVAAEAQKDALSAYANALFIDQSWTWLTGRDDLMLALQDVHPNAAGHALISRYVSRSLDGELVIPETSWVELAVPSGYTAGHRGRNLSVKRRGWTVYIDGSMLKTAAITTFAEYGIIPYGFRPTFETSLMGTPSDTAGISGSPVALHVYPSGHVRRYHAPAPLGILMNDSFQIA